MCSGDFPGDFRLRFGKCYDADKCVLDSGCEFYTEHATDAEAYLAPLIAPDEITDSGREKDATAPPNFAAGNTSPDLPS